MFSLLHKSLFFVRAITACATSQRVVSVIVGEIAGIRSIGEIILLKSKLVGTHWEISLHLLLGMG